MAEDHAKPAGGTEISDAELEIIARVCHEANRAFAAAHGDFSHPVWDEAEDWMREATYEGIRYRLANPEAPPGAQHRQWMEQKRATGWTYGAVKDGEAKTHPLLIPFEELPEREKQKDALFMGVISALTERL